MDPRPHASMLKKFKCPQCPESYDSPRGLGNHKKMHNSGKKFICSDCKYGCNNARNLKSHCRTHRTSRRAVPTSDNDTPVRNALRRANAEHELRPNDEQETESSDVDEDEYVVESDDDIPAVETNAVVERNPAPTFVWKKVGQKVPLTGLVRCQTDVDTGKDNAHAAPIATTSSSATTSTAGIYVASATERRSDANSFRVKTAATSNSQSTASAARTAIVSAVSDKVPAWLNHDDMNNLVVRAGQDAKWVVKFGGKPAPKVAWSKDQQLINPKTSAPIQVDTKTNDHTTLKIPVTTLADCGAYTLLVSNSKGMDTKTAHLTVLGKPSKPLGPLEVNDVTEDGCVLRWKPPEDNGGLPIEHYEVEKLEGGKWVRCAKLSNCATKVKGLKKGQQYQFRVKAVNKEGKSEPLSTEHEIIAKNQYDEPGKPGPSIKYVFLTPLPNTMDIYRTKQGVLACKLNSARAPLVWQRDGKPIDVDDPRYQIEKDAAGCFTLTIRVVEQIDQGMWTASVNKDVISKCQVYAVEDPRDTFVVQLKSLSANENENATFECEVNDEDIDVEWFHGDAKIKMDGRHFKEERVGCHRRLLITNLLIEDHGQYKCTTKDDKTMAQLTVDPLKKFECEAGKEKRIKVPFEVKGTRRGDPKPILLRNGKPVDLNKMKDHVEVIINGTVAEIVFKDPQKSEAGKWSLKLANTGGVSAEAAFELVVNGKPKTHKRPLNTLDVTSNSCIVPGGVRALKRQSILDRNRTSCEEEFDDLLLLCDHRAAVSWANLEQSTGSFDNWSKIGEGAFGEVFKFDSIAVKIMPFAIKKEQCSKLVNGVELKTAKFIFNELFITKQLTELSEDTGSDFVTPSFTQLRMKKIVKGCFPKKLLKAWDAFKKAKPELSENERPDIYADEDLHFVIIGLSYGGKDLEAYTIRNGPECYSIFHQVALSLAIAETVLEFEHRDLHAGNILVEQCAVNEKIRYIYQGKKIDVVSNGVRASIIDFSISRLTKKPEGVPFFVDLSQDAGLFAQNGVSDGGDYQYDVYRMMKTVASENWSSFWPQTNRNLDRFAISLAILIFCPCLLILLPENDGNTAHSAETQSAPGDVGRSARCSQPDTTKPTCAGGQQKQYDKRQRRDIRSNGTANGMALSVPRLWHQFSGRLLLRVSHPTDAATPTADYPVRLPPASPRTLPFCPTSCCPSCRCFFFADFSLFVGTLVMPLPARHASVLSLSYAQIPRPPQKALPERTNELCDCST
ncbi:hypothetical protein niasHT_003471 [Heterodera trifolii]|uniref:Non-specific serine/threonine protein kinase n=1 Tax=Heterodera trifolii TaxID=157864 RepID=A0ABD2LY43_9BILA